jgi:pSer/pThr/pTyr-binding forkhead associated (FHA) protein
MITLMLTQAGETRPLHFDQDLVTFGRSKGNTLPLNDRKVSRKHAKIERAGAVWKITDLESGNGTRVNGQKIDVHELVLEDQIRIGDAELVVKAMEAETGEASDPATDLDIRIADA